MEIWIIRNGEKYGPFHDYDIRRRITEGELEADAPAWHEGLAAWSTLSKIQLFENEFQAGVKSAPIPSPTPPPAAEILPPPIPQPPKLLRRFWARWLDIHVYVAIWWLFLWGTGRNIEAIFLNPWIIISQLVPWFVIETLLIHRFATTPGKWLLGMTVINHDGSRLDLLQSARRAFRIYGFGIGLGLSFVSFFCMALSAWTTRRIGNPVWDHLGKHRVTSAPLIGWRVILVIFLFFAAIQAQMAVTFPYHVKLASQQFPEMKEYFEKNPQWHLPSRHP